MTLFNVLLTTAFTIINTIFYRMRESKERIVSITNFSDQTVKDVIRYCYSYPTTINQNNCEVYPCNS